MFVQCKKAVCAPLLAALALLGACSGGDDSGAPPGTVEAEVVTVTPIYRLVPDVPPQGCGNGVDAAGATKPCGAAAPSAQREPDGFDVAYRYDGSVYHTHTDYRPGDYLQVSALPRHGGGGSARANP